jgi:SAM-dependent methyltransferase
MMYLCQLRENMAISTTEIPSGAIASDNPIHQRLLFAYKEAAEHIYGEVLDIGCGEGRGLDYLIAKADKFTAIDKIKEVLDGVRERFPDIELINANIPPFSMVESNSKDCVVSFQVIEHIEEDHLFVEEIHRVLKPGGRAIISTPNISMSLTRNPWHVREYTVEEYRQLMSKYFDKVEIYGVYGSQRVDDYYEENKASVEKITRFDILNLQYRLPRSILQIPYDILNRMNRNKLQKANNSLVMDINIDDYHLKKADERAYDLFCICEK